MQVNRKRWKKISAAILLGLFAFILVEKNNHDHNNLPGTLNGHNNTVIHSGFDCLICDFQLTNDADLPVAAAIDTASQPACCHNFSIPENINSGAVSLPAERGPPACIS